MKHEYDSLKKEIEQNVIPHIEKGLGISLFPSIKPACGYVKKELNEIYKEFNFTIFQKSNKIDEDLDKLLRRSI